MCVAGEPDRAALLSRGGDAEALVVPGANQQHPPPHHAADAQEIALLGVGGLLPSNPEGLAGEACTTEGGVVRCKAGWVGGRRLLLLFPGGTVHQPVVVEPAVARAWSVAGEPEYLVLLCVLEEGQTVEKKQLHVGILARWVHVSS